MSQEMMNTKEVAHYLGVHEKQVYALIKSKRIPSTRVTGKWIFPKPLIDEWIEMNAKKGLGQAKEKSGRIGGALLASGSNDPILDMLHTHMRKILSRILYFFGQYRQLRGAQGPEHGIYGHCLVSSL